MRAIFYLSLVIAAVSVKTHFIFCLRPGFDRRRPCMAFAVNWAFFLAFLKPNLTLRSATKAYERNQSAKLAKGTVRQPSCFSLLLYQKIDFPAFHFKALPTKDFSQLEDRTFMVQEGDKFVFKGGTLKRNKNRKFEPEVY